MSNAYIVRDGAESTQMTRIKCKNESKELQRLLEKNYDLLPGNQIRPNDPCRWLLVRREMPVQDPNSGDNRWSIDLNRQMERSEVLIVEAKQYEHDELRVVIPSLFGYTEEARRIKKTVTVSSDGQKKKKWDEISFFEEAKKRLDSDGLESVRKLYKYFVSRGCTIRWGTGKQNGSYSIVVPSLYQKSILSVYTNGYLQFLFGSMRGNDIIVSFRDSFATSIKKSMKFDLPVELNKKYPIFKITEWSQKCDDLISIFESLLRGYLKDSS